MFVSQGEHDHSRNPVRANALQNLLGRHGRWQIQTVLATGSTNTDLALQASHGAADRTVLIAEEQLAGKGRLGRTWTAPAGSGLTMSVLLRVPQVPLQRRGWIGVLLGLAVVCACEDIAGVPAELKWPNDVLIDGAKCAGILGELAQDALVVGVGLNVSLRRDELPRADTTSLELAGATVLDRERLAVDILGHLDRLLDRWTAAAGDIDASGIRDDYLANCATIGSRVRVELPTGEQLHGLALDVSTGGDLVVKLDDGRIRSFSAADVLHLRRPG